MKLNFLKFLVVTAALSLAGSAQNAQALNLSYLRARWHAFLSHNNNSTGTSTTTAGTAIGSSDTNSVGVTTNQVATTNMVAPQNVTTQSVTSAGNNAVNGAPGSFGVTGVGVTTPANSVTTSQSGSGNVSAGTNGVSANTGATTNSTASAKTGSGLSGNSMIAAEKNRTQTTSLAQRLINAGSISRGSGSATSASSADSNPNSVSASGSNSNLTQNIHFDLTFYEAASNRVGNDIVTPVAVTDGDIIAALGNATGNQFSGGAQLILAMDANSTNSPGVIEVLDGSNAVDVSSYFSVSNSEIQVSGKTSAGQLQNGNGATGLRNGLRVGQSNVTYSILYVSFDSNGVTNSPTGTGLSFDVSGFNKTTPAGADEIQAKVSGTGTDTNGTPAVLKGTISVGGKNNSTP